MLDKDFQQDIRAWLCDINSGIDEGNKLLEELKSEISQIKAIVQQAKTGIDFLDPEGSNLIGL